MATYDSVLRSLMRRVGITPIKSICTGITVQAVHRIAVYYADGRAAHSVATLIQHRGEQKHQLTTYFDGLFDNKPLIHEIDDDTCVQYSAALQKAHFDTVRDMPDRKLNGSTIWCVERATGTHHHIVLFNPDLVEKPYSIITNAVDAYLPEAIRRISLAD